ncbi:HAD-IIIA family hydrolase [Candidatus Woesearchaeota archaeon]|nr:HAD-IIIA family hydrolase [Candidatus Woesearchaeota archaeon]
MKKWIPHYEFDDVTKIDENLFKDKELIIFDIDNTLFYPETTHIKPEFKEWFLKINKKYKCICFSNSFTIEKRKNEIIKQIGCELFMSKHKKPSKKLFNEILEKYSVHKNKVLVVGDFRFTDIWFGKRSGGITILVKPFGKESFKIRLLRFLENIIIKLI